MRAIRTPGGLVGWVGDEFFDALADDELAIGGCVLNSRSTPSGERRRSSTVESGRRCESWERSAWWGAG
jgi:hypothetical protein